MKNVIIDPPYEHGTVVKRVCGDKIAKKMHAATKVISERLDMYLMNKVLHGQYAGRSKLLQHAIKH